MDQVLERQNHRLMVIEAEAIGAPTDVTLPRRRVKVTLVSVGPGNNVDLAYYTQKAIDSAAPLFEGVRCFLNHSSKLQKAIQPERTAEELVGFFSDVHVEGEKLVAVLNIMDGPEYDDLWNKIKAAIAYSKKYPGRVILGLSIAAGGEVLPIELNGKKWKAVQRFTDVKSVDIVTYPARGGEFQTILNESEVFTEMFEAGVGASNMATFTRASEVAPAGWEGVVKALKSHPEIDNPYALVNWMDKEGYTPHKASEAEPQAGDIFKTLKDHTDGLRKSGAPGAEETGRIIDKLGTALKLNKEEDHGTMDPNPQQPTSSPDNDFTGGEAFRREAQLCAESYSQRAQSEMDETKKGHLSKMAEAFKKMGEGSLTITHNPPPAAPHVDAPAVPAAQSEEERIKAAAEAEAKRQAEAAQAGAGNQPKLPGGMASESEKVFEKKYLDMLTKDLLDKSGLPEASKKLLKMTFLESERDEKKIREKISTYVEVYLQESQRHTGHGFERRTPTNGGDAKPELKNSRPGLKKLISVGKAGK